MLVGAHVVDAASERDHLAPHEACPWRTRRL